MNIQALIADAYKDGQIVAESGDEITANMYQRGLRQLNAFIRSLNLEGKSIVYQAVDEQNMVIGQEGYVLNLLGIDYLFFLLDGQVRTEIKLTDMGHYYKSATILGSTSLPSIGTVFKNPDFTLSLKVYMPPSNTWSLKAIGTKAIAQFDLNDDFPAELLPYQNLLTWGTASKLRRIEHLPFDGQLLLDIEGEKKSLFNVKNRNLTINRSNALRTTRNNWAIDNLAKPFLPRSN